MSLVQYKISSGSYDISFTKLDTDEYEFSTTYNYMEYYGKSYLKSLAFVTNFNLYLNEMNSKIEIKHIDSSNSIMIELPIPFSDKLEIVQLKMVEIDEFKKLNLIILKNSDEIKKEITALRNKADSSITKILNSQLKTNDGITKKIQSLEKNYTALLNEVKELRCSQKKYYLIGDQRPCSWKYSNINHAKIITSMFKEAYKLMNPEGVPGHYLNYMALLRIMGQAGFILTPASFIRVHTSAGSFRFELEYTVGKKFDNVVEVYNTGYGDDYSKSFVNVIKDEIRMAVFCFTDDFHGPRLGNMRVIYY